MNLTPNVSILNSLPLSINGLKLGFDSDSDH